jgi:phosphatidylglycerol:prolipoprotein diacylglycerol transferase
MWYSLGRFFIEALREDSLMLGSFKMAQIVSIGMFLVGLFFFVRRFKEGRFDHLYNDENVEIRSVSNSQ